MAILIKYVVEHKGVEKLVTTDKKEADKYDKMLDVADNLAVYIEQKGIELTDDVKEKILGLNAAKLYNIDVAAKKAELAGAPVQIAAE